MAESGIYEIRNRVNGKRYCGSAVDIQQRWREHQKGLKAGRHHCRHLQAAWSLYGSEAFDFLVIELCSPERLIEREQKALDELKPEYNIAKKAGSTLGVRFTPETKAKIAAKAKGRKYPPRDAAYRAKLSAAQKGRAKSPEHLAKLQAGRSKRVFTEEQRATISERLKSAYQEGRKSRERSPEYRAKIAATLMGRKATPEHRANQSAAQRGRKHRKPYKLDPAKAEQRIARGKWLSETFNRRGVARSPEIIKKMSAALTGRKLSPEHKAAIGANSKELWRTRRDEILAAQAAALPTRRRPDYAASAAKTAAKLKGRKLSPDTRAKMSASHTGKKRGPYNFKRKALAASDDKQGVLPLDG